MAPDLDRVRVRLVQIRTRPEVLTEERASFQKRTGMAAANLLSANALDEMITTDWLDGVDAVMIGGAGAYSVTETYDWTPALIDLCHACADRQLPLFGSCWGHQFVARAFGGEVVNDPTRAEMGTHRVSLTDAGRLDPLFSTLPETFGTQMGHQDRVARLPDGAVELASNGRAPFQAFRLGDAPIYGTQFHSELDVETERQRLVAYRDHYPEIAGDAEFDAVIDALYETPDADDLLRRFLMLFAVEDGAERLAVG
ncbi:type 1 glutamine amidotransferase [Rubrivirga sp. IMCC43871]|uniref:type 1 glutamine amidotransferase n=1 Tax=Rubrivirga sp. IMCC43871 TaxID=3391575 RepID=UPI0039901832